MGKMDTTMAKSTTGATPPKGAASSDRTGERMEKMRGGVAMGKEDKMGADKQFNTDSHARLNGLLNITNDKDLKCLV